MSIHDKIERLQSAGSELYTEGRSLLLNEVHQEGQAAGADIKKDVSSAALQNLDKITSSLQMIPDGTYPIGAVTGMYEKLTGQNLSGVPFLDGVTTLKKHGDHIELNRSHSVDFKINASAGPASVDAIEAGNVKFDLKRDGKNVSIQNLEGLTVKGSAMGMDLSGDITQIDLSRDAQGRLNISSKVDNPLPGVVKWELDGPDQYNPRFVVGKDGKVQLVNKEELEGNTKRALAVDAGAVALTGPLGLVTGPVINKVVDLFD